MRTFYKADDKFIYKIVFGAWFEVKFKISKKNPQNGWKQVSIIEYKGI